MGSSPLSSLFIPIEQLPDLYRLPPNCLANDTSPFPSSPTFFGFAQLAFLGATYSLCLSVGSNLISDGSELLLLIPSIAPIVGSLVLPILGAVPDGCIVLFSGLGPRSRVQQELSVGVGALAGSTVQLLTVPWFLAVVAGRVPMINGECDYKRKNAPTGVAGVQPVAGMMRSGAIAMLATTLPYVFIQGSAFSSRGDTDGERVSSEGNWALAGLVVCVIMLIAYIAHHARGNDESHEKIVSDLQNQVRVEAIKKGLINVAGAFRQVLSKYKPELDNAPSSRLLMSSHRHLSSEFTQLRSVVKVFFRDFDENADGCIDKAELKPLLVHLGQYRSPEETQLLLEWMDTDGSGTIEFDEFVAGMAKLVEGDQFVPAEVAATNYGTMSLQQQSSRGISVVEHGVHAATATANTTTSSNQDDGDTNAEDDEEEEEDRPEVPVDLAHLSPEQQQSRILLRATRMMAVGSLLVIAFSDPLVGVLGALGDALGVSGFYVSFCLAPVASNLSEYIATFQYAKKRTSKSITIAFSTLIGAAVLNNTFCLGVFLALVKFRELQWTFSAETIAILFVELCMTRVALWKTHTLSSAFLVLSLFPAALALVAFLENVVGLD